MNELNKVMSHADKYCIEFLPFQAKVMEDARLKIAEKKNEILGDLVKALENSIPNERWSYLFHKKIDFSMPVEAKREEEEDKIILWKFLEETSLFRIGLSLIFFSKSDIIDAGFENWKHFTESIETDWTNDETDNLRIGVAIGPPDENKERFVFSLFIQGLSNEFYNED